MAFRASFLAATLACAALAGSTGCLAVAAGAAGGASVAYVMGEFEAQLEGRPQAVVKAAKKALEDMDIHVTASAATAVDGKVEGRTALEKSVTIQVERADDEHCKIGIRIGTWGDEELSRQIYERIRAKL